MRRLSLLLVTTLFFFGSILTINPRRVLAACWPAYQKSYSCYANGSGCYVFNNCIYRWSCNVPDGTEEVECCNPGDATCGGGNPSCQGAGGACAQASGASQPRNLIAVEDAYTCHKQWDGVTPGACSCVNGGGMGGYCDWQYWEGHDYGPPYGWTTDCPASRCGTYVDNACSCGCTDTTNGSGCGCHVMNSSNCTSSIQGYNQSGQYIACRWYTTTEPGPGQSCQFLSDSCGDKIAQNVCGDWFLCSNTPCPPTATCSNLVVSGTNGFVPYPMTATLTGYFSGTTNNYFQINFGNGYVDSSGAQSNSTFNYSNRPNTYFAAGTYVVNGYVSVDGNTWVGGSGNCQKTVTVSTPTGAWWQAVGGDIYGSQIRSGIPSTVPSGSRYILLD